MDSFSHTTVQLFVRSLFGHYHMSNCQQNEQTNS